MSQPLPVCDHLQLLIDLAQQAADLAHICSGAQAGVHLPGDLIDIVSNVVDFRVELAQLGGWALPELRLTDAGPDSIA